MKNIVRVFIIILILGLTVNHALVSGEATQGMGQQQGTAEVYHVVVKGVPFVVFALPGEDGKVPTKEEVIAMLENQLNGSSLSEYYASTLELNDYSSPELSTYPVHTPPKVPIMPQFAFPSLPLPELPVITIGGSTLLLIGVPALIALVLIMEYRDDIEDKVKNEYEKIRNTKYSIEIREASNTFRKGSFKSTGRITLSASVIEHLLENSTIPSLEPAITTLKRGHFVHFIDHMLPAIAGELVAVQVIQEKYRGQIREISKNGKAGPDFRVRLPSKEVPWEAKGKWWRSPNGQLKRGYCQIQKYTPEKRGYVSVLVVIESWKKVVKGEEPSVIFIGWYDRAGLVDCNKY
ncbi:hypothetical protein FH039_02160 [Thermococcus indicus]|uniref:Uncharacterized protein n=1 Tax=Thermococcus indicus TaxID=2586643 RepID=A0A4Y5SIL7_9EURY|nr:hypothetical protein [Thermococcus indicus]QDA30656.1 hypothetical protein FH039_02160 [Thermococcus indicus]